MSVKKCKARRCGQTDKVKWQSWREAVSLKTFSLIWEKMRSDRRKWSGNPDKKWLARKLSCWYDEDRSIICRMTFDRMKSSQGIFEHWMNIRNGLINILIQKPHGKNSILKMFHLEQSISPLDAKFEHLTWMYVRCISRISKVRSKEAKSCVDPALVKEASIDLDLGLELSETVRAV